MDRTQRAPRKGEREFAMVLSRRARKRLPDFESMEELSLVPYLDVMMNLVIFMLVTIASFMPLGLLTIFPPSIRKDEAAAAAPPPEESINLTVGISADGNYKLLTVKGELPPIARTDTGDWNYAALNAKAVELKKEHPNERTVTLTADRTVRYDTFVKTMDALRNKEGQILFDDVKIGSVQ